MEFIPINRASEITKYSKDYIGQLCRAKKIVAKRDGKKWLVSEQSIRDHKRAADEFYGLTNTESETIAPKQSADTRKIVSEEPFLSVSSIRYITDSRPLLPVLRAKNVVQSDLHEPVEVPVRVKRSFRTAALTAAMLAVIIAAISSLGAARGIWNDLNSDIGMVQGQGLDLTANVGDAIGSAASAVGGWFGGIKDGAVFAIRNFLGINGAIPIVVSVPATNLTSHSASNQTSSGSQSHVSSAAPSVIAARTTYVNSIDPSILARLSRLETFTANLNIPAVPYNTSIPSNIYSYVTAQSASNAYSTGNDITSAISTLTTNGSFTNPTISVGSISGANITSSTISANSLTVNGISSTTSLFVSATTTTGNLAIGGLAGASTRCLQVNADGSVTANSAACGTGSGSGSSWATTTSQTPGVLINHSLNNSDVIAIGNTSTTSAAFWFDPNTGKSFGLNTRDITDGANVFYSDARVNSYVNGSSTIPKLYTANTWTALQTFGNNISLGGATLNVSGLSNGQFLQYNGTNWVNAAVSGGGNVSTSSIPTVGGLAYWTGNGTPSTLGTVATTTVACSGFISCTGFSALGANSTIAVNGALGVGNGGTGQTSFGQGWIYSNGGTGALNSSTSPTVAYLVATSSTASIFPYASTTALTSTGSAYFATLGGNVGIGTTSPWRALSISANTNHPLVIADTGSGAYMDITQGGGVFTMNAVGSTNFKLTNGANGGYMGPASNGDVILSVDGTSAKNRFYVNSSGNGFRVGDTSDTNYLDFISGGVQSQWSASGNRPMKFTLNNTDVMTMVASGNVGVGTTTPFARLAVTGSSTDSTGAFLVANSNNAQLFNVLNSGNVGIGTSTPGSILSINNVANFTTATSSFYGNGLNLANGCYAVNNNCLSLSNLGGTVAVANGGTGQASFGQGWLAVNDSGAFTSSTSPTVNYITATSTTATSTFAGGLAVGANQFIVQHATGNVGIGTTSPASILDVFGGASYSGPILQIHNNPADTSNPSEFRNDIGTTTNYGRFSFYEGSILQGYLQYIGTNYSTASRRGNFEIAPGSGGKIVLGNNDLIDFGSSKIAIGGDPAVTPGRKLRIGQSSDTFNGMEFTANSATWTLDNRGSITTPNNSFWLNSPSGNTTAFLDNGNVGIGTTSPQAKLESVNTSSGATADQMYLSNLASATSTASRLSFRANDVTNGTTTSAIASVLLQNFNTGKGALVFSTLNAGSLSEGMRLDSTGNLGIGTTSPSQLLSVGGNAYITGNLGIGASSAGVAPAASFYVSASTTASSTVTIASVNSADQFSADGGLLLTNPYNPNNGSTGYMAPPIIFEASGASSKRGLFVLQSRMTNNASAACGSISTCPQLQFLEGTTTSSSYTGSNYSLRTLATLDRASGLVLNSIPISGMSSLNFANTATGIGVASQGTATYLMQTNNWYMQNTANGSDNIMGWGNNNSTYPGILTFYRNGDLGFSSSTPGAHFAITSLSTATTTFAVAAKSGQTADIIDVFNGSGNNVFDINASSNVGIGTSSPWGTLSVNTTSSTAAPYFAIASTTNGATQTLLVLDKNGNLGIGTSTPFALLSVQAIGQNGSSTPLFAVATTTATPSFMIDQNGLISVNTPGATSTWTGNLYVKGTLRSTNSYVGDLVFGNGFRFTEATGTTQALLTKNQAGDTVANLDEKGNLALSGDICTDNANCFSSLASSSAAAAQAAQANQQATAQLSLQTLQMGQSLQTNYQAMNGNFNVLNSNIAVLASTTGNFESRISNLESIASSSATAYQLTASSTFLNVLASATSARLLADNATSTSTSTPPTSFIGKVAQAVLDILKSAENFAVAKITSTLAVFTHVDTQSINTETATVSNGLQMNDSATGQVYCVRITNGDFAKTPGACGALATGTSTPPVPTMATSSTPAVMIAAPQTITQTIIMPSSQQPVTNNQQPTANNPATTTSTTPAVPTSLVSPTVHFSPASSTPSTITAEPASTPTKVTTPTPTPSPAVNSTPIVTATPVALPAPASSPVAPAPAPTIANQASAAPALQAPAVTAPAPVAVPTNAQASAPSTP
jgi:hypothetical protein